MIFYSSIYIRRITIVRDHFPILSHHYNHAKAEVSNSSITSTHHKLPPHSNNDLLLPNETEQRALVECVHHLADQSDYRATTSILKTNKRFHQYTELYISYRGRARSM